MKKIVLSIAGVMAAAAFAPEASALPAFARQTGMACSACHAQHFPVLNGFGRAFKAAGYTMMGAQEKVEGEHLSIPSTLNSAILLKARYQKTNGTDAVGTISGQTTNGGQWQIPDEFALFMGGRVAENIGFLFEGSLVGGGLGNGSLVAGLKLPIVFDMGTAKLSVTPFLTDVNGFGYGYEESSTGIVAGVRWSEMRSDVSAAQYVGIRAAASGLAFVAKNDMGYINLTRFSPNFALAPVGAVGGVQMKSNYLRIAATPTVGDWDMHIAAGFVSGSNYTGTVAPILVDTKMTIADLQAQGQVGGKDLSVYATYASAPKVTAVVGGTTGNFYNAGLSTKSAYTIGADYSVIPHTLHVGASIRRGKTGATAANESDNAFLVQGIYDMTQNVALHATYSKYSGSAYDVLGTKNAAAVGGTGNSLMMFMLEAAW